MVFPLKLGMLPLIWFSVLFFITFSGINAANGQEKTVLPIPGKEITFTVADVVATVEVRAKSQGPGACGVEFSTNLNDKINFLAPPYVFSPWTFLSSHTGSFSYKVSVDVKCDTDVLPEVRFFKK